MFVNYPQLHEAKVIAFSTEVGEWKLPSGNATTTPSTTTAVAASGVERVLYDTVTANKWRKDSEAEKEFYFKGMFLSF